MRSRLLLASLIAIVAACTSSKDGVRSFTVQEGKDVNLGKIKETDGPVTVRLVAKNEYSDTLHPVQIHTSCGCTRVQFEAKPVPPGAEEVWEITYNPAYRPGPMREEIQVRYLESPVRTRTFAITGEVIGFNHPIEEDRPYAFGEGLYMSHKVLTYGSLRPGETGDFFFRHGNGNTRKADIVFDIPDAWKPYVRMRQPGKMKADQRDTIHVKFTMPEGLDSVEFALQPRVNGKKTEESLLIRAWKR